MQRGSSFNCRKVIGPLEGRIEGTAAEEGQEAKEEVELRDETSRLRVYTYLADYSLQRVVTVPRNVMQSKER